MEPFCDMAATQVGKVHANQPSGCSIHYTNIKLLVWNKELQFEVCAESGDFPFQMLLEKLDGVTPQLLDTSTVPELSIEDNATNTGE